MKRAVEEKREAEEPKRACREGPKSDMEEFFALLDRISAMEKLHPRTKGPIHHKRMMTCEPVWRPAFVWEDFCSDGNGSRTRDVESKPGEEDRKEEALQANKNDDDDCSKNTYDFLKGWRSPSSDPNNEGGGIQILDLNLPSEGLQHFF